MKKILGYIPLEPGDTLQTKSLVWIEEQPFKLAEVWVPGVAVCQPEKTMNFQGRVVERCKNCGKYYVDHIGPSKFCPATGFLSTKDVI